jgi:hypothetical protein
MSSECSKIEIGKQFSFSFLKSMTNVNFTLLYQYFQSKKSFVSEKIFLKLIYWTGLEVIRGSFDIQSEDGENDLQKN